MQAEQSQIEIYLKIITIFGGILLLLFTAIGSLAMYWLKRNEIEKCKIRDDLIVSNRVVSDKLEKSHKEVSDKLEKSTNNFSFVVTDLKMVIMKVSDQLNVFETGITKDIEMQKLIISDHIKMLLDYGETLDKHTSEIHDLDRDIETICKAHKKQHGEDLLK